MFFVETFVRQLLLSLAGVALSSVAWIPPSYTHPDMCDTPCVHGTTYIHDTYILESFPACDFSDGVRDACRYAAG